MKDEKKTKAKLIEEISELRQRLGLFQRMAEDSPDGIVISDVHGRVTYFSPGAETLTGYPAEEALKMRAADFYPGGVEAARQIMQRLRAEGQVRNHRQEFIAKDGQVIEADISMSLLHDEDGEETGILVIYKDASGLKRAEEALRESEERRERERAESVHPASSRPAGIDDTDEVLDSTVNEPARLVGETGATQPDLSVEEEGRGGDTGHVMATKKPTTMTPLEPERAEFYYNLGVAYYALGQRERAIESYSEAVRLNPEYSTAYNNRGKAYHDLGQHERAVEDYAAAVRLNPEYPAAYNNRGIAYYDQGRHEHAIEDYTAAVSLNPEYAAAYNNRGNAYHALGQQERAIEDYDAAVGLDPGHSAAYNNRGTAYHALGQHARAIEDYDAAIGLNPEYSAAYNNRGTAYHDLGQHERAMEDYDAAIGLDPEDTEVYINRGNTLSSLFQYERSIEDYDVAIRLNPDYLDAYHNRGVTFHLLGKYAESERDFARVAELRSPDDGGPSDGDRPDG